MNKADKIGHYALKLMSINDRISDYEITLGRLKKEEEETKKTIKILKEDLKNGK